LTKPKINRKDNGKAALVTIAPGHDHSLAIKADGSLWAWGGNEYGQLGDGTRCPNWWCLSSHSRTTDRSAPVRVGSDNDWATVSAGSHWTVAIKNDGSLWAWGCNFEGELGDETRIHRSVPVRIGTDNDWAAVSAASDFVGTLLLKSDGSLWGLCDDGPVQMPGGYAGSKGRKKYLKKWSDSQREIAGCGWKTVFQGTFHIIGIKLDGSLWVWGDVNNITFSNLTYDEVCRHPTRVGTDNDWTTVSAGTYQSVALKADGALWAWGQNGLGEVGDGTRTHRKAPVQVGTDSDWASISAGQGHTLALKTDGSLWVWGGNRGGVLGCGSRKLRCCHPTRVGTDNDWAAAEAGDYYTLALKNDGSLWAWGENNRAGRLGDGTMENRKTPVLVGTGFRVPIQQPPEELM